jgi:hypothetical protein
VVEGAGEERLPGDFEHASVEPRHRVEPSCGAGRRRGFCP